MPEFNYFMLFIITLVIILMCANQCMHRLDNAQEFQSSEIEFTFTVFICGKNIQLDAPS